MSKSTTEENILKYEFSADTVPAQATDTALKPSELRIGNKIGRDEKIFTVTGIGEFINISGFGDRFSYSAFEPVALSPDILQKCRFTDKKFYLLETGGMYSYDSTPVPYLHKLQNLYFALTGCELEVDL
jgi:hypothetical protein